MKFNNSILCAFTESSTNSEDEDALLGLVDDDLLDGLRVSLGHHALEGSGCTVDTLRIAYGVDGHRMHADRIIALADTRKIRITVPYVGSKWRDAWTLALPPVACHLDIALFDHRASALTRPSDAALQELSRSASVAPGSARPRLTAPQLLSLCSLMLNTVSVEEPFQLPVEKVYNCQTKTRT